MGMVDLRRYEKLHTIQLLKQIIRRWWRLEVALADATGYVLDHAEGRLAPPNNHFCDLSLNSKEGFLRCQESLKLARGDVRPRSRRRTVVRECHLGFDLIACPFFFDGVLGGLLFLCGTVREPLGPSAEEVLLKKVRELGITLGQASSASLHEQAPKLPHLPEEELGRLCDMLELGAAEIEATHAEWKRRAEAEAAFNQTLGDRYRFESIIGTSKPMQAVFRLLEKIVQSESTVLVQGESGTGKELVAKAIHFNGPRAKKSFVVQNCSAFNDNLLESALFGHAKGSFTGAIRDKKGLFEVADGGTFFLDEVGDMSPALQVKLLRVLQEGTFTPVGSNETRQVDVRVIAATHKDLYQMVQRGQFREDLYYRINVIRVAVPPLRERLDDIELLVGHFLHKHSRRAGGGKPPPRIAAEAVEAMRRYTWPGNVRELENEVERMIVLGGDLGELPADLLSSRVREAEGSNGTPSTPRYEEAGSLKSALEQLESEIIHRGLIRTHWNKSQLAKELGISRSSLISKAERYRLDKKPE